MKRVVYSLSAAIALVLMAVEASCAQSMPRDVRLSPSNLQRFSRDLIPSSAQDFFNAGQMHLEQEIRLLTRPRSALNENLLIIRQNPQAQPAEPLQPASSPQNKRLRGES